MTMVKKKQIICPITKIQCDSKQEMYFIWWMVDLKKTGYIKDFKRSKTYNLSEKKSFRQIINEKVLLRSLLQSHDYTPDFVILWDEKAKDIFYCDYTKVTIKNCPFITTKEPAFSIVEVKGVSDQRSDKTGSLAKFAVNRKWMFKDRQLYVELVEIQQLFIQTFTPKRYLLTDSGRQKRKINWRIMSIEDYKNVRTSVK